MVDGEWVDFNSFNVMSDDYAHTNSSACARHCVETYADTVRLIRELRDNKPITQVQHREPT